VLQLQQDEFSNPQDPDDPTDIPTQEKAELIQQLIHGLAMTAATHGFYLRCWIQVINVMIYKKPGVIELDKLRVIRLFEADFNLSVAWCLLRPLRHASSSGPTVDP
jgi:hypothetical protein